MIAEMDDDFETDGRSYLPGVAVRTPAYIVGLMHLRDERQALDAQRNKIGQFDWRGFRQQSKPGPVWFQKQPWTTQGKFLQRHRRGNL